MNLLQLLTTAGVPEALHAPPSPASSGCGKGSDRCKNTYINEFERKNCPDEYLAGVLIFESRRGAR